MAQLRSPSWVQGTGLIMVFPEERWGGRGGEGVMLPSAVVGGD